MNCYCHYCHHHYYYHYYFPEIVMYSDVISK